MSDDWYIKHVEKMVIQLADTLIEISPNGPQPDNYRHDWIATIAWRKCRSIASLRKQECRDE